MFQDKLLCSTIYSNIPFYTKEIQIDPSLIPYFQHFSLSLESETKMCLKESKSFKKYRISQSI